MRGVLALAAIGGGASTSLADGDYEWSGKSGVTWLNPGNWLVRGNPATDPPGIGPTAGVDVFLADPRERLLRVNGPGTITLGSLTALTPISLENRVVVAADSLINDLRMTFGLADFEANAPTTIDDLLWQVGTIEGLAPITLTGDALLFGPIQREIGTRVLNEGTFRIVDPATISLGADLPAADFTNTGTIEGVGLLTREAGSTARILNSGTIEAGAGNFTIGAPVELAGGTLDPGLGTLTLGRGLSVTGGGTIDGFGTVLLQGGFGAEPYQVEDVLTINGELTDVLVRSDLDVLAGSFIFAGSGLGADQGLLLDADVALDGTIIVTGLATLGDTMLAGTGSFTVDPTGVLRTEVAPAVRSIDLDGGMTVRGSLEHEGGTLGLIDGTTLSVEPEGTLSLASGAVTGGAVRVHGTLVRPADGSGTLARVDSALELLDGSTVRNQFETLRFGGIGFWGDTVVTTDSGATTTLGTLDHILAGEIRFTGEGSFVVPPGGRMAGSSGTSRNEMIEGDDGLGFVLDGGELNFDSGVFVNEGDFVWSGGMIDALGGAGPVFENVEGGSVVVDGIDSILGAELRHAGDLFRVEEPLVLDASGRLIADGAEIDLVDAGIGRVPFTDGRIELRSGGVLRRSVDASVPLVSVTAPILAAENANGRIETVGGDLRLSELIEHGGGTLTLSAGADTTLRVAAGIDDIQAFDEAMVHGEGAGTIEFTGGRAEGVLLTTSGRTILDGMELVAPSEWTVQGPGVWRSGTIAFDETGFSARVEVQTDDFVIEGAGQKTLDGQFVVAAGGTVFHEDGAIEMSGGIDVRAGGFWVLSGGVSVGTDPELFNSDFENDGTVSKVGPGTATIASYVVPDAPTAETVVFEGDLSIVDLNLEEPNVLAGGTWIVNDGARLLLGDSVNRIGPGARVRVSGDAIAGFPALDRLALLQGELSVEGLLPNPITVEGRLSLPDGDLEAGTVTTRRNPPERISGDVQGVIALVDGAAIPRLITPLLDNESGRIVPGGVGTFGSVAVTGEVVLGEDGFVVIDAGPTGVDGFEVDGPIQLGGALRIDAIDDWTPAIGTQVTVLSATGEITGAFADVTSPDLGTWSIATGGGAVIATLTAGPTCGRDVDQDGDVGLSDLITVLAGWGYCPSCAADVDRDDEVGLSDLLAVLADWGPCGG